MASTSPSSSFLSRHISHRVAEMYCGVKNALQISRDLSFRLKPALFHSSPILERKRHSYWDSRSNNYSKRARRIHMKQTLLRNVSAYTDFLFQSWQDEREEDPSSSKGSSWFKRQCSPKGSKRSSSFNQGPQSWGRRGFQFTEDDVDVETIFRSTFGSGRSFYFSFVNEESPQWSRGSNSYSYKFGRSWNPRFRFEDDPDDSYTDSESSEPDMISSRRVLGLNARGPLKLEDVKNAYRVCALKWHPDRHQGSSKGAAEEKFKLCSAAYQSLCQKLEVN